MQLNAQGHLHTQCQGASYTVLPAWLLPAVGNQMAVVGNQMAAWVSPEPLVTELGSDTGCCGSAGCWDLTSWLAWLGDWESS